MNSNLDGKIDEIIELILQGFSYRKIAEKLTVPLSTLHDYTSKSEHSARAREALEYSAQTFDDKAEEILLNAESVPTEIQRARELAQHYRWKASKRNPRRYGDKIELENTGVMKFIITTREKAIEEQGEQDNHTSL